MLGIMLVRERSGTLNKDDAVSAGCNCGEGNKRAMLPPASFPLALDLSASTVHGTRYFSRAIRPPRRAKFCHSIGLICCDSLLCSQFHQLLIVLATRKFCTAFFGGESIIFTPG